MTKTHNGIYKKWIRLDMKVMNKCLRKYGMTQRELCKALDISLRSWALWTKDNRMPANVFLEICEIFGWLNEPTSLNIRFNSDITL